MVSSTFLAGGDCWSRYSRSFSGSGFSSLVSGGASHLDFVTASGLDVFGGTGQSLWVSQPVPFFLASTVYRLLDLYARFFCSCGVFFASLGYGDRLL